MSEIIATPINNNFHVEQQQPMSLTHQSADNVIQLEMETKRARSSSMDILAEAATYTYGVEASAKRISPSIDTSSSSSSANNNSKNIYSDKKVDVPSVPKFQLALVESSIPDLHRPRGATFSYSPYNSKDPSIEIQYRPIVNGNATPRTLNWYATAADDEVNTVELLSGLSHTKKPLTPMTGKDIYNFGNFNADSSSVENVPVAILAGASNATARVLPTGETDDGSTDLENDMSILAAVANQMNSDDANGGEIYNSPYMVALDYSGRARSYSMPLISYGGRRSGEGGFGRPRANSMNYKDMVSGNSNVVIGAYTPEERRMRIQRFLEKRRNRVWTKKVKYDVRKNFADSRIRVKGRFIRKQDEEVLSTLVALPAVTPNKNK